MQDLPTHSFPSKTYTLDSHDSSVFKPNAIVEPLHLWKANKPLIANKTKNKKTLLFLFCFSIMISKLHGALQKFFWRLFECMCHAFWKKLSEHRCPSGPFTSSNTKRPKFIIFIFLHSKFPCKSPSKIKNPFVVVFLTPKRCFKLHGPLQKFFWRLFKCICHAFWKKLSERRCPWGPFTSSNTKRSKFIIFFFLH